MAGEVTGSCFQLDQNHGSTLQIPPLARAVPGTEQAQSQASSP